ncbi:AGE family epimerase/isomerase [Salinicola avicenniae]|uniref:AGE family epimerase/isomerase n=1 Tax=Salinicola avicenniae TaxID=2916836 RepID=UPI00207425BA|nr:MULTISPECIES: AGE family epimerase/isomerase [unclassified Salinicola]
MPFTEPAQLQHQIAATMAFYHPRCIDPQAGFFHYLTDDGQRYNRERRHLLSSAGYIAIYARHAAYSGDNEYLAWARHGLRYLETYHYQTRRQSYAWTLDHHRPDDATPRCEGLAAILLAYAALLRAGAQEASRGLTRVYHLLETHFYEPHWQRYADEADPNWQLTDYRSQRANLQVVEALLDAYEATQVSGYLTRARDVARSLWRQRMLLDDGWLWEHYDADWQPDFTFHRDRPEDAFRPWGFQIGDQLKWAHQLIRLSCLEGAESWMREIAQRLFIETVDSAWDTRHGGLMRSLDFNRLPLDRDKHYWVQAEALAVAAWLGDLTGEARYWRWFDRLGHYCWQVFVDHRHGAWFATLTPENRRYSREKSPAGKTDQASLMACHALLTIMRRRLAA